MTYKLGSMFGKDNDKTEHTGTIPAPTATLAQKPVDRTGLPPDRDLVFAKAAVSEVLDKGTKDASAPWENPGTGARGTVTPLASAYTQDGTECRDFLASYLINGTESWMQGAACKMQPGRWEVRQLRPWKRT